MLVWDARDSKLLLDSARSNSSGMSFTPDGHFFACAVAGQGLSVWKESPAGYIPHQRLPFATETIRTGPLLSPNGGSVLVSNGLTTNLWHTKGQHLSHPDVPISVASRADFIVEFSPDGTLAAVARLREGTIVVLDLDVGGPRLAIDTHMSIVCLRLTGSAVVVSDGSSLAIWNLPAEDHASTIKADITDRAQVTNHIPLGCTFGASISPDLSRVAAIDEYSALGIYHLSTKNLTWATTKWGALPSFSRDGRQIWCMDSSPSGCTVGPNGSSAVEPDCSPSTILQPRTEGVFPWQSSRGYEVTDDGWVLSPTKKRLLWLPHRWRSHGQPMAWGGRFLGLLHYELPEAAILELYEN